jgi:hypothetical protein
VVLSVPTLIAAFFARRDRRRLDAMAAKAGSNRAYTAEGAKGAR